MRSCVFIASSLDGFIARPDGDIDWLMADEYSMPGEDYGFGEFYATVSCLVLGRNTFDKVLALSGWPYGKKRVIVLSRSMNELPEGLPDTVEISSENPVSISARLEREGESKLYIDGGIVVQSFLAADRIDELIVTRFPLLLGRGIPLFGMLDAELRFRLVDNRAFESGLVQSRYERNRET